MWFTSVPHAVLSILTIASIIAAIALLVGIVTRHRLPALEHVCWVVVLIRLIAPPWIPVTTPGFPTTTTASTHHMDDVPRVTTTTSLLESFDPRALESSQQFPSTEDRSRTLPESHPTVATSNPGEPVDSPSRPTAAINSDTDPSPKSVAVPATSSVVLNEPFNAQAGGTPKVIRSNSISPLNESRWNRIGPSIGSVTIWRVFGIAWGMGMIWTLVRKMRSVRRFSRLLQLSTHADAELAMASERIAQQMQMSFVPRVKTLAARVPPLVWSGLGGTLVVLPQDLVGKNGPETRDMLLTHEFAHLQRRDHWVRWLELVVSVVWWWCPLVWWVKSRLHQAEEAACDARVLSLWPNQAETYGKVIVETVRFVADPGVRPPLTTGGSCSLKQLEHRLLSIHQQRSAIPRKLWRGTLLGMLAMVSCPLLLVGQTPGPAPPPASDTESNVVDPAPSTTYSKMVGDIPTSNKEADDLLPVNARWLYARMSPDQNRIAFVGSLLSDQGERQHGLFCFDISQNVTVQLLGKAIKTAPAWSPDSKQIAIGNAAGYGNRYPLVIIDVDSKIVTETGVQGAGASWSPDGRLVAVSTEFHQGGSWAMGVPCDGRIAIWDTITRQLIEMSPPGVHSMDDRGQSFITGGVRPIWSPDGEWIAWQQAVRLQTTRDDTHKRSEIWVAKRDGASRQRVLEDATEVRWTANSRSIVDTESNVTHDIDPNPKNADQHWPRPPDEFADTGKEVQAAAERAAKFEVQPFLNAHRLWQNPTLDGIESVEFTHRMSPEILVESFQWRRDGTSRVAVVQRESESELYGEGWSVIRTPDGASYTSKGPGQPPRYRTAEEMARSDHSWKRDRLSAKELLRRETLRQLTGARLNFAALDWGRRPEDFRVTDFFQQDQTQRVEIRPTANAARRAVLNGGAMFHTTSWSYVHGLRMDRAVLTLGDNQRILQEVAYLGPDIQAKIELRDWKQTAHGQAPLHIVMTFPKQKFRVDQRYRITPEGLWILQSGSSQFESNEAQHEEVVDLRFNAPGDELSSQLDQVRRLHSELSTTPVDDSQQIALQGFTPLELGAEHQLRSSRQSTVAGPQLRSITWQPFDTTRSDPGHWPSAELCAVLNFDPAPSSTPASNRGTEIAKSVDPQLMLVLYDELRSPLFATTIPESTAISRQPTADESLRRTLDIVRSWDTHDESDERSLSYRVETSEEVFDQSTTDATSQSNRITTLSLALDAVVLSPQAWRVPIAFSADWDGRPVHVFGLTGPSFKQEFGVGVPGKEGRGVTYRGGYSIARGSQFMLMVDAQTGLPLVERSESAEIQYQDYADAGQGRLVPLRVRCRSQAVLQDLRFQLIDQDLWLFERRQSDNPKSIVRLTNWKVDGVPPRSIQRSSLVDEEEVDDWFDWETLTSRRVHRSQDLLSASFARFNSPWNHPSWKTLGGLNSQAHKDGSLTVRLRVNAFPPIRNACYWTLTRITDQEADALISDRTPEDASLRMVRAIPYQTNQPRSFPWGTDPKMRHTNDFGSPDSEKKFTRIQKFEIRGSELGPSTRTSSQNGDANRSPESSRLVLKPEIVSQQWYSDQNVRVTGVLVRDGVAVAGGVGNDSFRTHQTPETNHDVKTILMNSESQAADMVVVGMQPLVTGAPMGSVWGRFMSSEPLFAFNDLLDNPHADVRLAGLRFLYVSLRRDLMRQETRRSSGRQDRRIAEAIFPYQTRLESLLASSQDQTPETLAIACRLAGFSENEKHSNALLGLTKHKNATVRDSAFIGLAWLGQPVALEAVNELVAKFDTRETAPTDPLRSNTVRDAQWGLSRLVR